MSHPIGFSSYSHSSLQSIFSPSLFILMSLFQSITSLNCLQHSAIEKCEPPPPPSSSLDVQLICSFSVKTPMMNTCMTTRYGYCLTREINGRIERNCDGNGVQQVRRIKNDKEYHIFHCSSQYAKK